MGKNMITFVADIRIILRELFLISHIGWRAKSKMPLRMNQVEK